MSASFAAVPGFTITITPTQETTAAPATTLTVAAPTAPPKPTAVPQSALGQSCSSLTFRSPVRSTSALMAETEQEIQTRLTNIKAQGGIVKVTPLQLQNFKITLQRYGTNVENFINTIEVGFQQFINTAETDVKQAAANVNKFIDTAATNAVPALNEAITLMTAVDGDLEVLTNFLNGVATAIPAAATQLLPIVAVLTGLEAALQLSILESNSIVTAMTNAKNVGKDLAAGNTQTASKDASSVVNEVGTGLDALATSGHIKPTLVNQIKQYLSAGVNIATQAAQAAGKTLGKVDVKVYPAPQAVARMAVA